MLLYSRDDAAWIATCDRIVDIGKPFQGIKRCNRSAAIAGDNTDRQAQSLIVELSKAGEFFFARLLDTIVVICGVCRNDPSTAEWRESVRKTAEYFAIRKAAIAGLAEGKA